MTYQSYTSTCTCATLGQLCSFGRSVYHSIHNSIKLVKSKVTLNVVSSKTMDSVLQQIHSVDTDAILNKPIDKNAILDKYVDDCKKMGHLDQVTTTKKVSQPTQLLPILPSTTSSVIA